MTEKLALITGASRGLGAALAEALVPDYHVLAVGRTTGALEDIDDLIQAKGGSATLAPMDICETPAMAQLCRSIYDRWGKVDLWCHTAIHAAPLAPVNHIDVKDFSRSMKVNVEAASQLISFVAPLLGTEGQAVFFDDTGASGKFFGSYGASKAAQMQLVRSWQAETVKTGPHVHILRPNPMPTATRARFFPGEDRETLSLTKDEAARLLALLPIQGHAPRT
ncbi:MAG: SDR family oxidoreductase [Pseudomonadota bacterium]